MAGSPITSGADKAAADRGQSPKIITDDTERRRKILLMNQ
jgi:hypothetical protein